MKHPIGFAARSVLPTIPDVDIGGDKKVDLFDIN